MTGRPPWFRQLAACLALVPALALPASAREPGGENGGALEAGFQPRVHRGRVHRIPGTGHDAWTPVLQDPGLAE